MIALLLAAHLALTQEPGLHRYALVVGEERGDSDEVSLRYARRDAERVAEVLRDLGRVAPEDLLLLTDVDAETMRRALIGLNARIRDQAGPSLLLVYYSGHGDAQALHLRHTQLEGAELRELVAGSPASARVLVVDSCRSGALTQVKGGSPQPAFAVHLDESLAARGTAILTSSAATEDSQESDRIGGSFFSHFFVSGLRGAADANADGEVSLSEAFAYAAERTLLATEKTLVGPQHPTFHFDLGGRGDLALTEPRRALDRLGALVLPAGSFLVLAGDREGTPVAEVLADAPRTLALTEGPYFVVWRKPDELVQGVTQVEVGQSLALDTGQFEHLDYAQVVRKGGTERWESLSLFVEGSARGDLIGLGIAPGASAGVRLDLAPLSVEARLGYGYSFTRNPRVGVSTHEGDLALAALHAFDFGRLSLAVGLEAGPALLAQQFDVPQNPNRFSFGLALGPTASLQVGLTRSIYARFDAAFLTYLVDQGDAPTQAHLATPFTWQSDLGLGVYL